MDTPQKGAEKLISLEARRIRDAFSKMSEQEMRAHLTSVVQGMGLDWVTAQDLEAMSLSKMIKTARTLDQLAGQFPQFLAETDAFLAQADRGSSHPKLTVVPTSPKTP